MDQIEISAMLTKSGFIKSQVERNLKHGAAVAFLADQMWSLSPDKTKTWEPGHPFAPAIKSMVAVQMKEWLNLVQWEHKQLVSDLELLPVLSRLYGNLLKRDYGSDSDDNFFLFRINSIEPEFIKNLVEW